jgi:hypothetical protein
LPTFFAYNHSLRIVAVGPHGELTGDPLSPEERDGRHSHGPESAKRAELKPGDKFALRDDLISWLGELEPGTYKIHAAYSGDFFSIESPPVVLRVQAAAPVALSIPRYGAATSDAPLTGAWANRHGGGFSLMFQEFSPNLPRNLRHGVRAADVRQLAGLWAAVKARPTIPEGHLLWAEGHGQLQLTPVDLQRPHENPAVHLKLPFPGRPLQSPLTLAPDAVAFVLADDKGERLAGVRADLSGACQAAELDLGKGKPLGAYACLWQFDQQLHFLWAGQRGRELMYGRLQLGDVPGGFATRTLHIANDPIIAVDAALDLSATLQGMPYFADPKKEESATELHEPSPPGLIVWCVTSSRTKIVATPLVVGGTVKKAPVAFTHDNADALKVVSSVVTRVHELVLLLADSQRHLYVASTSTRSLEPLAEVTKASVLADQSPALVAARENGLEAWVYLAYIADKSAVKFIRVEPKDEPDPVEKPAHASGAQVIDTGK